jgi:hypothetical protein
MTHGQKNINIFNGHVRQQLITFYLWTSTKPVVGKLPL